MKKILFILITLLSVSAVTYASFPVTQNADTENVMLEEPNATSNSANTIDWPLFIVCFLVGTLGIHRFMMGDITNGILMLLTFGGCGIWALIDLIRIATGDLKR